MRYSTPHGDKLRALLENDKLPADDRRRVRNAMVRYDEWIAEMERVRGGGEDLVAPLIALLNRYKKSLDLDLVFDSEEDFLYRQKGQLKLDNTVLEEFLPWLVGRVFVDRLTEHGLILGPMNTFSQMHFDTDLRGAAVGGGMTIRSKDHDFAMARPLFLKASHSEDFGESSEARTHIAFLAAEIKTNLDKTMFQEASATARDLKLAAPHSRYFVLCEWLDMTPISTAVTAIDEVIVLRKAKRLSSDIRARFSTAFGRVEHRDAFERYLTENAFAPGAFRRFLSHVDVLLGNADENESDALRRGWF